MKSTLQLESIFTNREYALQKMAISLSTKKGKALKSMLGMYGRRGIRAQLNLGGYIMTPLSQDVKDFP